MPLLAWGQLHKGQLPSGDDRRGREKKGSWVGLGGPTQGDNRSRERVHTGLSIPRLLKDI